MGTVRALVKIYEYESSMRFVWNDEIQNVTSTGMVGRHGKLAAVRNSEGIVRTGGYYDARRGGLSDDEARGMSLWRARVCAPLCTCFASASTWLLIF